MPGRERQHVSTVDNRYSAAILTMGCLPITRITNFISNNKETISCYVYLDKVISTNAFSQ